MLTRWLLGWATIIVPSVVTAATWTPEDVRQFIVVPTDGQALTWQALPEPANKTLKYVIRDYWDQQVADSVAEVIDGGLVRIPFARPPGYYEVEFPDSGQRFGVISSPPPAEPRDPFFSIDAAMSWLVKEDALRESLVQVLRRTGIVMARERLSWAQINPARDRWEWDGSARYDKLRQCYATHDVELLEMFHDAPAWPGRIEKYPDDLVATAHAWQEISRRWHKRWEALEVWNEPDIFFGGNLPADQYVPLVKALAWVQQAAHTGTPIVGGVFAHDNAKFLDCAAANGMLDCIQVASFHTYGRALGMAELIGRYRQWLSAARSPRSAAVDYRMRPALETRAGPAAGPRRCREARWISR